MLKSAMTSCITFLITTFFPPGKKLVAATSNSNSNSNSNKYIIKRILVKSPQMRRARACIWAYTVLPATRTLNPIGKDSSPITTQSSPAVTHCILAAPQFTYPEGMEG